LPIVEALLLKLVRLIHLVLQHHGRASLKEKLQSVIGSIRYRKSRLWVMACNAFLCLAVLSRNVHVSFRVVSHGA